MDQLKQAFAILRKYHFWILCVLILILYIGTWYVSTATMTQTTNERAGKIESAFKTGQQIVSISNHPNKTTADMMKALSSAEAEQVRLAWDKRYREQEDVLKWPQELLPDFIAAVEPLVPIEAKVDFPTPARQELKVDFRNRYRDYIKKELPKLAKIIGAEWQAGLTSGSGYGGWSSGMMPGAGSMMPGSGSMMPGSTGPPSGGPRAGSTGMGQGATIGLPPGGGSSDYSPAGRGMGSGGMGSGSPYGRGTAQGMEESRIVVDWNSGNQSMLQAQCMGWTSPTTLQVLYAQEDLWILRALMLIVKATNGDADAQYNAAVKEIQSIELGAMAAGIKAVGMVESGKALAGQGGMMSGSYMPGATMSAGSAGMGSGSGGSSGSPYEATGTSSSGAGSSSGSSEGGSSAAFGSGMSGTRQAMDPAAGRYVDDKNEPLTGERLRTAMKSNQPSDAFLAVAKRMPMRMRVRMNVLKLPLFLCEFAKSNLPVEVRQVRINAPAGSGGMRGSGAPTGSIGGSGGPSSGPTGMGMGTGGGGGSSAGMSIAMPDAGAGASMPGAGGLSLPSLGGTGSPYGGSGMGSSGSPYGGGGPGGPGMFGTESPYDVIVEVYGIIYIYNPVDPAKLGMEAAKVLASAPGGAPVGAESTAGADAMEPAAEGADAAEMPAEQEAGPATEPDEPAAEAAGPAAEPTTTPEAEPGAPTTEPDALPADTPATSSAETGEATPATPPASGGAGGS